MKKLLCLIISMCFMLYPMAFANTTYVFDNNQNQTNASYQNQDNDDDSLKGYVAKIAAGTSFDVYLKNPINTASASKGDTIVAVLTNNFTYNNMVIAPQGSLVYGTISKAHSASYGYRNGYVQVNFDKIQTPEGKELKISTEKIDFKVDSTGKLSSAAGKVATGAIIGLLGGLLVAAIGGHSDSIARSVAIGSAIGAGGGLVSSAAEKGVDAEIPAFTELNIVLEKPLKISVTY